MIIDLQAIGTWYPMHQLHIGGTGVLCKSSASSRKVILRYQEKAYLNTEN